MNDSDKSTAKRTNGPREYLTAREIEQIESDPVLELEDVVAHRRDQDGLARYDR